MANIVVIEDHPPVLKLISTLCRAEGPAVMAFDNGRTGLDAIRDLSPDVALVGRRLGETDGLDVIRDAREPPKTRSDIVSAIRRGACNSVTKPYQPDGLRPGCGLKFDLGNFPPVTH